MRIFSLFPARYCPMACVFLLDILCQWPASLWLLLTLVVPLPSFWMTQPTRSYSFSYCVIEINLTLVLWQPHTSRFTSGNLPFLKLSPQCLTMSYHLSSLIEHLFLLVKTGTALPSLSTSPVTSLPFAGKHAVWIAQQVPFWGAICHLTWARLSCHLITYMRRIELSEETV